MKRVLAWSLMLLGLLAGCASKSLTTSPVAQDTAAPAGSEKAAAAPVWLRHWEGRLSLSVHQTPMQTVLAGFELDGDEQAGEMRILGPWGSAAWILQWQPGQATFSDGQHSRSAPDLQQLMRHLTGVDLPIGLIFDGLHGRAIQAPGWWIEPSDGRQDRLYAVRLEPLPRIELLIQLQKSQQ